MVCACFDVHVAGAVVHAVGRRRTRAAWSPRGETPSCRRAKSQRVARRRRRRSPTDVMQVPPSGLPSRRSCRPASAAACPCRRRRERSASGFRTIGLKLTLTSLSANSCSLQEVEQRRVSCRPSSRRSCRRSRSGTRRRRARMFSMMRSNVPWPPRSGRIRLWVSRSPSSVIFTPRSPNGSRRSTTSGVSSRPLVMMLMRHRHAARLRSRATAARPGSTSPAG